MLNCTLKPEKKEEFLAAVRQLPNAYKNQAGFVDLLTFVSDESPNRALVVAVWKTKGDSEEFYRFHAPLLDLKPYIDEQQIEHYFLETSNVYNIATSRAA
jgi:heme-degrading monooxygenase HmoA